MLKEDISSTAFELTKLILFISVTFSVTCLTVTSLITKSCQQRWPISLPFPFYKVVLLQIWGLVVDFRINWSQLISVCNSERIIIIICQSCAQREKGPVFFDSQCITLFCHQLHGDRKKTGLVPLFKSLLQILLLLFIFLFFDIYYYYCCCCCRRRRRCRLLHTTAPVLRACYVTIGSARKKYASEGCLEVVLRR